MTFWILELCVISLLIDADSFKKNTPVADKDHVKVFIKLSSIHYIGEM